MVASNDVLIASGLVSESFPVSNEHFSRDYKYNIDHPSVFITLWNPRMNKILMSQIIVPVNVIKSASLIKQHLYSMCIGLLSFKLYEPIPTGTILYPIINAHKIRSFD